MFTKNLDNIEITTEGNKLISSNAGAVGLRKPEEIFDLQMFAEETLKATKSELDNRPERILSLMDGSIAGLLQILKEGVDAEGP